MRTLIFAAAAFGASACLLETQDTILGGKLAAAAGGAGGDGASGMAPGGGDGCSAPPDEDGPIEISARIPPPITGGTMEVDADGTVVVGDSDRDQIYIVRNYDLASTVKLRAGDRPGRLAFGPSGTAFVSLQGAGEIAVVDLAGGYVASRIRVCGAPRGVGYRSSTRSLYVACATGELLEVANTELRTLRELTRPILDLRDLIVVPDGLLVSTFRNAEIFHIGLNGEVSVYDTLPRGPLFTQRVAWRMRDYCGFPILTSQREALTPLASTGPCGGYGAPNQAVVTDVEVLRPFRIPDGMRVGVGNSSDTVLAVDVATAGSCGAIAVASAGTNQITMANPNWHQVDVDGQPVSLAYRKDELIVFTRSPAQLTFFHGDVALAPLPLDTRSVRDTGHQLFHRAGSSHVACASCHPEAGDDGHIWSTPNGLRRTPSLRGGIVGTEPFHWSGDEADMPALVADVLVKRLNGAGQTAERALALEHWLDAQPAMPRPPIQSASVARGELVFGSPRTQCSVCHSGQMGTNNATVDVGTGGAFQVPRLVEVAYHSSFLHDGRAATLAERFDPIAGGQMHGFVSSLSDQELTDLKAYLLSR